MRGAGRDMPGSSQYICYADYLAAMYLAAAAADCAHTSSAAS